jgi:hypothetical protein
VGEGSGRSGYEGRKTFDEPVMRTIFGEDITGLLECFLVQLSDRRGLRGSSDLYFLSALRKFREWEDLKVLELTMLKCWKTI